MFLIRMVNLRSIPIGCPKLKLRFRNFQKKLQGGQVNLATFFLVYSNSIAYFCMFYWDTDGLKALLPFFRGLISIRNVFVISLLSLRVCD